MKRSEPRRHRPAPYSHAATGRPGAPNRSPRPTPGEIAFAASDAMVFEEIETRFIAAGDTAGMTAFHLAVDAVRAETMPKRPAKTIKPVAVTPGPLRITPADVARARRAAVHATLTATLPEVGDRMQRTYEVDLYGDAAPAYKVTWSGINDRGQACAEIEPVGPKTGPRGTWRCTDLIAANSKVLEGSCAA